MTYHGMTDTLTLLPTIVAREFISATNGLVVDLILAIPAITLQVIRTLQYIG